MRPRGSHAGDAEVKSSVRLQLRIRNGISTISDMTNRIEWMRKQIEDQHKDAGDPLLDAMEQIDARLKAVESRMTRTPIP